MLAHYYVYHRRTHCFFPRPSSAARPGLDRPLLLFIQVNISLFNPYSIPIYLINPYTLNCSLSTPYLLPIYSLFTSTPYTTIPSDDRYQDEAAHHDDVHVAGGSAASGGGGGRQRSWQ